MEDGMWVLLYIKTSSQRDSPSNRHYRRLELLKCGFGARGRLPVGWTMLVYGTRITTAPGDRAMIRGPTVNSWGYHFQHFLRCFVYQTRLLQS